MFKHLQDIYVLSYKSLETYFSAKNESFVFASFLKLDSNSVIAAYKSAVESR